MPQNETIQDLGLDEYKYDFVAKTEPVFRAEKGLSEEVVRQISAHKEEPEWMLEYRLKALEVYNSKPMPKWGGDLDSLEAVLDEIYFYVRPQDQMERSWDDVPDEIKNTFEKLGIPEAERKILAGVGAQYESEMVYHSLREEWAAQGVIFDSIEDGLKNHPELFREHFGTIIPMHDNKFAAMNSAVWSGGSFVYIPKGVSLDTPLQAYFRVNQERMGQFERTLIIIEEGAQAHYIEGCTAPVYSTESFHSGVIEIVVKKNARFRYTTIQNWSNNMYNLVTQRSMVHEGATMEWLDGNLGSKLTMKYPSCTVPDRRRRARRDHVDRIRRRRPTPGYRRQSGCTWLRIRPLRSSQSRSRRGMGAPRTAACAKCTRVRTTHVPMSSATRCSSTIPHARILIRTSRSKRTMQTSAMKLRYRRSVKSSSSTWRVAASPRTKPWR